MKRFARTFAPASTAAAITLLFAAAPVAARMAGSASAI